MTGARAPKRSPKPASGSKVQKKKSFESVPLNCDNDAVTQYLTARSEPDSSCRSSPEYERYCERERAGLDERWAVVLAVIVLGVVIAGIMMVAYYRPYLGIKE